MKKHIHTYIHTYILIIFVIALAAVFGSCKKGDENAIIGVVLNKTNAVLNVGDTLTLASIVLPQNAPNKTVTWTSGDPAIANVVDGLVTALRDGRTTITVTTEEGHKTQTCTLVVNLSLGTISFVTNNTWVVGDQEWSDAVQTTYCSEKTNYKGVDKKDPMKWKYLADCRSNPGQKGDLFSWEMVNQQKNLLCPEGWRVPTSDDFTTLDITLGGTGWGREDSPEINEFMDANYLNPEIWGGEYSGYINDGASQVEKQGTGVYYWSQTEASKDLAHYLKLFDKGIGVGTYAYVLKANGYSLRCVRDRQ